MLLLFHRKRTCVTQRRCLGNTGAATSQLRQRRGACIWGPSGLQLRPTSGSPTSRVTPETGCPPTDSEVPHGTGQCSPAVEHMAFRPRSQEPENGTVQWAAPCCSHRVRGTVLPKALALECTSLFLPRIQTLSPAPRNTQTVLISLKTISLYPLGVGTPTLIANSLHTFAAASRSQRSGRHLRAKPRCPGAPTSQSLCSRAPCGARVCGCCVILTALSWSEA